MSSEAGPSPPIDGNIASRLGIVARLMGSAIAIAEPTGRPVAPGRGERDYRLTTFKQLDDRSTRIARGMMSIGYRPGRRVVMLVPFGAEFITLVFALLKTGAEVVLIDPGIDRRHLVECLAEAKPDGFAGIAKAQCIRSALSRRFPAAEANIVVGLPNWMARWSDHHWSGRWVGKRLGRSLQQIEQLGSGANGGSLPSMPALPERPALPELHELPELPERTREDAAAIIFTTGSTGPPKGVAYTHGTFHAQVDRIRERYDIHRGSRDLACFPLFGLFDAVMGVTTVIPDMDPTRPADVDPRKLIQAAEQWQCDQAFGSPALWKTVVDWADRNVTAGRPLATLRRVLSAGAPVPATTLQKLRQLVDPDADIHTPYGSTEALPIASIESRQIITHTGPAAEKGKGVCVGHRFEGVRWKIIEIDDGVIATTDDWTERPRGKIGEIVVTGPMVTRQYKVRVDQNAVHKVTGQTSDGHDEIWHRMGDAGYLDDEDRFWFCGRKAHRVVGDGRTWWTIPCEAIFNAHPAVNRSALVGRGDRPDQIPVMIVQPVTPMRIDKERLLTELRDRSSRNPLTRRIEEIILWPRSLPVDIRHNSKIFRERLAAEINGD